MPKLPKEFHSTKYGFYWNGICVERAVSTPERAGVLTITTPRQRMEVHVTPTGYIRVSGPHKTRNPQ